MKFIVIRSHLKEGIAAVERATGENANLPILKNILIEANDGKIKITATNLDIAITATISGKVLEPGKFTVPAGFIANMMNNLQNDRLNIEEKKGKLEIKTDNYEALLQGMPADDFPITPKIKHQEEWMEIKGEILRDALNQTLIATQFSDIRPELNAVLFKFSLNNLKLAATDSFRLAERSISSEQFSVGQREPFEVIIPLKTTQELSRIIKDDEMVKIYRDENQILFKTPQIELLSRLIDGKFPDYEAIIPKKFSSELIFNKQELMNGLKLAGIFGNKNGEVKFKMQENKKAIQLVSSDQTLGENSYMLPVKAQGNINDIVFNWRYLADVLKIVKGEEVFFGINGESEPAEIKAPGDASYLYILKPIAE